MVPQLIQQLSERSPRRSKSFHKLISRSYTKLIFDETTMATSKKKSQHSNSARFTSLAVGSSSQQALQSDSEGSGSYRICANSEGAGSNRNRAKSEDAGSYRNCAGRKRDVQGCESSGDVGDCTSDQVSSDDDVASSFDYDVQLSSPWLGAHGSRPDDAHSDEIGVSRLLQAVALNAVQHHGIDLKLRSCSDERDVQDSFQVGFQQFLFSNSKLHVFGIIVPVLVVYFVIKYMFLGATEPIHQLNKKHCPPCH